MCYIYLYSAQWRTRAGTDMDTKLTKTCASCGQKKPLAAFLQLTGPQGRTYGNICVTCRKTQAENAQAPKEPEEELAPKLQLKIDAKAKVFDAVAKRQRQEFLQERNEKERQKQQQIESTKTQKTKSIAKHEREHRETLFEKNRSDRVKQSYTASSVFGGSEHAAKARQINMVAPTGYGLTNTLNSETVRSFIAWLGADSPFAKATQKAIDKKTTQAKSEKEAPKSEPVSPSHPSRSQKS